MEQRLAVVNGGEAEGNQRLEALQEQFKDREFELRPYETRHEIVVKDTSRLETPTLEQMKRTAQGLTGISDRAEVQKNPMPKQP